MLDWDVSVSHVFREVNMSADWLARQGAMGSESLVYGDNPPQGMRNVLLNDATGIECVFGKTKKLKLF